MTITLVYRYPTPMHCGVSIFVNGALAGNIILRQSEVGGFQQIVERGCVKGIDTFLAKGSPEYVAPESE